MIWKLEFHFEALVRCWQVWRLNMIVAGNCWNCWFAMDVHHRLLYDRFLFWIWIGPSCQLLSFFENEMHSDALQAACLFQRFCSRRPKILWKTIADILAGSGFSWRGRITSKFLQGVRPPLISKSIGSNCSSFPFMKLGFHGFNTSRCSYFAYTLPSHSRIFQPWTSIILIGYCRIKETSSYYEHW